MDNRELIQKLDELGEVIKLLGESPIGISFRAAGDLILHDRFLVTVEGPGIPQGISGSADCLSTAFFKALAMRSDKLAELEREAAIRARIEAEMAEAA